MNVNYTQSGDNFINTQQAFTDAVYTGREIEFSYCGQHYFLSRRNATDWYVYHEGTRTEQHFLSADDLLINAILQNQNINSIWELISIDCVL